MQVEYDTQVALKELSECKTPLEATGYFSKHQDELKDWRYIYACEDNRGSYPLDNRRMADKAMIISSFHGKSLWLIDERMISPQGEVGYRVGKGIHLDSNTASYIYALAYKDNISSSLANQLEAIQSLNIDYSNVNPALYLWEAQRHFDKNPESLELCRKTFAAVSALEMINKPLNKEWREIYRKHYQEQAEAEIAPFFNHLINDLNRGLSKELETQSGWFEALLLKTKILEYSSSKSAEYKIDQLIHFMNDTLSIMLIRELAIYADILYHEHKSTMSQKLNSLHNQKDPLALIKNCAWDMYLFRIMDMMSSVNINVTPKPDFYIAELLACDRDIWGIYNLSALKGIAIHTKSNLHFPFLKNEPNTWLKERLGDKKANELDTIFNFSASNNRFKNQPSINIKAIIEELREELLTVLKR